MIAVAFAGMAKETFVTVQGIMNGAFALGIKIEVVGMDVEQRHPPVTGDPIELVEPDFGIWLAHEQEHGGILGQRIRKLHVAPAIRP